MLNIPAIVPIIKILLLAEFEVSSALREACEEGNAEIIKELLFYDVHMEDGGATLKELTKPRYGTSPFQVLERGYTRKIKTIVESLITEARNNNREHAASILEHINNQYTEEIFSSE